MTPLCFAHPVTSILLTAIGTSMKHSVEIATGKTININVFFRFAKKDYCLKKTLILLYLVRFMVGIDEQDILTYCRPATATVITAAAMAKAKKA